MSRQSLAGQLSRCSINTATLGHRQPLETIIEQVASLGFGWIAPWRRELEGRAPLTIARQIRDAGLRVSSYCRSTYIPSSDARTFAANLDDNRRAIEQAAQLGAESFVMVVGGMPEGSRDLPGAREQVREGLASLLEHAQQMDLPLALEPLHPMYAADRSCLSTLAQALDLCEQLEPSDSRYLGVAVDAYHCWWDPDLHLQIARAGAQRRLLGLHVCDWLVPTRDLLLDRGMMGDGVIDLAGLRHAMEDAGYRGPVEVEIFSFNNWWQRDPLEVLHTCAERLQSHC